jgi:hypothetical protein
VSDEQIAAARERISAGASLRSAAAEVPCAASTLSDRIKKAEVAEADVLMRGGIERTGGRPRGRAGMALPTVTTDDALGPLEVLRGALLANRVTGEPDWPTRVTAARALAALRPELVQSAAERAPAPPIIVYDLDPGSVPVLHRPLSGTGAEGDDLETQRELPLEPGIYILTEGDASMPIAEVNVVAGDTVTVHLLNSRAEAVDVLRAVGGDATTLETKLGGGKDSRQRKNARTN